ncbi:transglutaminase TgpA family protein [Calothrix sp. NIES-2098]|uniref:transglutaminase TgpA family protein n=1 Tax=Calothrix sp. NIES-2098 TaxID=1954171 RepID=UPI000B602939|nr:transglutaminase domain-containing protein [Calothrix sp. NIES-2098]
MFNLSRINQFWRLPVGHDYWRQNKQGPPLMEVEDSISLRVLVLALVMTGIVATDIAAETQFSLWAIPASVMGAIWSNRSRRNPNITVKFCIAIGMLVALGAFFGRLLGELNDTRLSLAELLIQLQILHSFDMPRRKDLGYSIVIGLILLGVAATLSQTLAFAPVLLLFLAIALPTLVLDYRSRLGLEKLNLKKQKVKEKKWSSLLPFYFLLFALILGLGLGIFAVLPRFPGYQLRTFPVSSNIAVKNNFTGRSIINPGYVRQGNGKNQGRGGNGDGQAKDGKPGNLDNNFYYGFNSQINQNLRGAMKPKVVMRVRSQAEGFWRVLGFDRYTGKGWEVSRNDDVLTLKRSPWSSQIFLASPAISGKTQQVVQTYTVVADLPNLIPALTYPKEIYFPTSVIAVDRENGLRSPVELSEGLTYTVISEVPYRDRTVLGQASTKYPKPIQKHYLQIPPEIEQKVRQRTEEILANYNRERVGKSTKTLDSPYEKALYLAQYLKQNYSIPENPFDLPYLGEKEDLVEAFLFKYKGGYPDHFSTVLTVMLRSIGIPARLVAGFSPGEFNPFTGMYVVRNTDAYAMTEVYIPKYGWFAFDPIPNHPLIPPSIEDVQTFSVLRQFWQWVAGWIPSPIRGWLDYVFSIIFSWLTRASAWFFALFSQGWLGVLTGLILTTTTAFFCWLGWEQWREWLNRRWLKKLSPMESLYQQMLQWADQKGLGKHPAQTPLEYAKVAYQHHSTANAQVIDEICQAYVGWRYGGHTPNLQQLRQRWQELKTTTAAQNSKFKFRFGRF